MHRLLQKKCEEKYDKVYQTIFCDKFNLSFYHPKKDQCSTCTKFKMLTDQDKDTFKSTYESHIQRKERTQKQKAEGKFRSTRDQTFKSATFDLESVLQIPTSNTLLLYYSRKLCVYNLCIYQSTPPNNEYCYCWSELEGKRGSNEIGTLL